MKLIIPRLNTMNKPSPISEGIAEIQINSQPYKGMNLTTWHTWARRAPWVATMHDLIQEMIRAHLTLVHVFHTYGSMDAPWVAHALSQCTPVRYDRIASVSMTYKATQFGDSIYLVCASTKSNGCSSGRNRRGTWSTQARATTLVLWI
jgi:hypothetical protein